MAGEVLNTYIIVEQGDKVLFIDKHAAHERLNFDRMKAEGYQPMVQALLEPVVFTPPAEEGAALLAQLPLLGRFGFEAEDFGGQQGTCFGMSDGAVCISPTVEQHASIAITSCATFRAVTGEEPRCAFLSYSTDGSGGSSEPVKKIRAALALAQQQRPDLKIDGEFQTDAAIDERVGSKKVKRPSEVAGRANVLIFPDAAACNIGSKLVLRFNKSVKQYGPLYQGFRLPILDCSRSSTDDTLYDNIALLSVLAADKQS